MGSNPISGSDAPNLVLDPPVLVSAAMSMPRKMFAALTIAAVTFMLQVGSVSAQVIVDPAVPSERNDGGWIYWIAIALTALGLLIIIRMTIKYMRYAPRFSKEEENLKVVRADRVQLGRELPRRNVDLSQAAPLVVAPPAMPTAAPALAPVGAAAAVPAGAPASAPAPAPAESAPQAAEAAEDSAEAPPDSAPEPAAAEVPPAAPAPAAPEERVEVSMDQEAYEAALKEHLDAGTDRRIAEGKAKRAGMIAARKKATGEA
jgi:hypothetical protein